MTIAFLESSNRKPLSTGGWLPCVPVNSPPRFVKSTLNFAPFSNCSANVCKKAETSKFSALTSVKTPNIIIFSEDSKFEKVILVNSCENFSTSMLFIYKIS